MIRYLMDENVDPIYQIQLLDRESELIVWAVGDEYQDYITYLPLRR
jgi:hypothetical protein